MHLLSSRGRKVFGLALIISLMALLSPSAQAQIPMSPAEYGPNAFPVPSIADSTAGRINYEIKSDAIFGTRRHDHTYNLCMRLAIPLFTPRVNLVLWMQVVEWWLYQPSTLQALGLPATAPLRGQGAGDAYVSIDIKALTQQRCWLDVVLRAAIKSASGGDSGLGRFFDVPGYFFDAALARSFPLGPGFFRSLRVAAEGGFLCWQTDRNVQNDAVMYGLKCALNTARFNFATSWHGYAGWQRNGDRPMVLDLRCGFPVSFATPFVAYTAGLHDYPFHSVSLGCELTLPRLRKPSPRPGKDS